jgi:hypothetical protein
LLSTHTHTHTHTHIHTHTHTHTHTLNFYCSSFPLSLSLSFSLSLISYVSVRICLMSKFKRQAVEPGSSCRFECLLMIEQGRSVFGGLIKAIEGVALSALYPSVMLINPPSPNFAELEEKRERRRGSKTKYCDIPVEQSLVLTSMKRFPWPPTPSVYSIVAKLKHYTLIPVAEFKTMVQFFPCF